MQWKLQQDLVTRLREGLKPLTTLTKDSMLNVIVKS